MAATTITTPELRAALCRAITARAVTTGRGDWLRAQIRETPFEKRPLADLKRLAMQVGAADALLNVSPLGPDAPCRLCDGNKMVELKAGGYTACPACK